MSQFQQTGRKSRKTRPGAQQLAEHDAATLDGGLPQ